MEQTFVYLAECYGKKQVSLHKAEYFTWFNFGHIGR